jgi:hypothetical protein
LDFDLPIHVIGVCVVILALHFENLGFQLFYGERFEFVFKFENFSIL